MKIISQITKIIPILLAILLMLSCSDDDDNGNNNRDLNIVETAQEVTNLSILVTALQIADGDLDTVLIGNGPFTVFAPTNAAFTQFLEDNDYSTLNDVPTDVLSQILLNHVVSGKVTSADLANSGSGYTKTNATGPNGTKLSLYFDAGTSVVLNGISTVIDPNIIASNGIIHIVDEVITLPTIADFALANDDFSSLVEAVLLADTDSSDPDFIGVLQGEGTYTVFAPTNLAFSDLFDEIDPTGSTSLDDLESDFVSEVILFHVVADENLTSSDLTSGIVSTLGGDITLDAENLIITDANDRIINIISDLVDIQAINGVVHAIDNVILPPQ